MVRFDWVVDWIWFVLTCEFVLARTWNFSGVSYDYTPLKDQVAEHNLGLHPAPPLSLLIPLVRDVVAWLDEAPSNVAILHDLGGRRSAVVAACCLLRIRQLERLRSKRSDKIEDAVSVDEKESEIVLKRIVRSMGKPGTALVPSQLRYVKYYARFERETSKAGPSQVLNLDKRLSFQRLIVNGIPDFVHSGNKGDAIDLNKVVCTPFIKIVKGQSVIAGTLPTSTYRYDDLCFSLQPKSPFPTSQASASDAVTSHDVPVDLSGDVLVKCYHQDTAKGTSIPMFALAFHTAFVSDGVLRLNAQDIDGAKNNGRFPRNFFVDLIFAYDPAKETSVRASDEDNTENDDAQNCTKEQNAPVQEDSDLSSAPAVPKFQKYISRRYLSAFSNDSVSSEQNNRENEPRYSLDDEDSGQVTDASNSRLTSQKSSDSNVGGLLDGMDGLDEDLALELEKYASDLEGIDLSTGAKESLGDIDNTLSDDDLDEEFDIDAFASSLDLDP